MLLSQVIKQVGLRGLHEPTAYSVTIVAKRFYKFWPEREASTSIFMPQNLEDRKLAAMPAIPLQLPKDVILPYKHPRACDDMRGPERIHNQLIYKKYGLIALGGGSLKACHFDMIKILTDKYIDFERFFATWRVDPPWKPVSKKSLGKRRGGGKTKVHHYETPVKAGRIIFEVVGLGEYAEIERVLYNISMRMPFYSMPISQKIMDDLKKEKLELDEKNYNPFEYRDIIRRNFSNSQSKLSPKEALWGGTYY